MLWQIALPSSLKVFIVALMKLDSKPPSVDYAEFVKSETRFSMLWNTHPQRAALLLDQARAEVHERFERYQQLAALDWDEEIQ